MKNLLLILALLLPGCTQWRKLTNTDRPSDQVNMTVPVAPGIVPLVMPQGDCVRVLVWGQSNAALATETWETLRVYLNTRYAHVEIVNIAVSATSSTQWASGQLNQILICQLQTFKPHIVLCAQGEGDNQHDLWLSNMKGLVAQMRGTLEASYAFALCSYSTLVPHQNNSIRSAQQELSSDMKVTLGPDMDAYRIPSLTTDESCLHFNSEGYRLIGEDWIKIMGGK